MMPTPPRNRCANVIPSIARKPALGSSKARRKWSGEKISDCGSEICGHPAKTLGVQNGDSPRASEAARKRTCGRNCDLASQGIVTAPESHGQDSTRHASANRPTVAGGGKAGAASRGGGGSGSCGGPARGGPPPSQSGVGKR